MTGRGNPSSDRQVSDLRPPMTANVSAPDPTAGERDTRCPGCGHSDCPRPRGWASLECDYDPAIPDADDASEREHADGCATEHTWSEDDCTCREPLTEAEREAVRTGWVTLDDLCAEVERIKAAAATKARADERKAAWDWFGEMLKAHQYEGQPIWDEYQTDRRTLLTRGDA